MRKNRFYTVEFCILVIAILLGISLKTWATQSVPTQYLVEAVIIGVIYMIGSIIVQKHKWLLSNHIGTVALEMIIANLMFLACAVMLFFAIKFISYSRMILFFSTTVFSLFEIVMIRLFHRKYQGKESLPPTTNPIHWLAQIRLGRTQWLLLDSIVIVFSFLLMAYLKPGTRRVVLPTYIGPWAIFGIIWLLVSLITDKYRIHEKKQFRTMVASVLGTNALIMAVTAMIMVTFKQIMYSRIIVLGTIGMATMLELIIAYLFSSTRSFMLDNPSYARTHWVTYSPLLEEETELEPEPIIFRNPRYNPEFAKPDSLANSIMVPLLNRYLDRNDELFLFLNDHLALENIHKVNSYIIESTSLYNIDTLEDDSIEFFVNISRVNDVRWINRYLIRVNQILKTGGLYIGNCETLEDRKYKLVGNLPRLIGGPIHAADFLINRILPKMPYLKGLYFSLTKGANRPLSQCEMLGRLYYCGFRVHETLRYNNRLYFIAIKEKSPSTDANPSYGPVFRMKRTGKNGKRIYVYKFRTMHPYAEYLQHYMVERYGYGDKGKIDDDFRVTEWGRVLRKLWLDELPQLYNLLKGDLGVVGVRPLSDRFLKEYPDELLQERSLYKPGCVPPYVALRMQRVEDYLESERIYLRQKKRHPLWTDVKFLIWAVFNILTNRIRSE
jgi:lipopolysaccharide/colanic/teichoic acid biosynthesis glycosyltransferase